MTPGTILSLVPLVLGLFAAQPAAVGTTVTRLVVQDELILRVPVVPPAGALVWEEQSGPKCIPAGAIRRAVLSGSGQVDFVLAGQRDRFRAEFGSDCPALDFYAGFYLQPQDERVCAGRDSVHSRMGGSCEIQRFSKMVPKGKR